MLDGLFPVGRVLSCRICLCPEQYVWKMEVRKWMDGSQRSVLTSLILNLTLSTTARRIAREVGYENQNSPQANFHAPVH